MSWLAPVLGGLFGLFGQNQQNQQNQSAATNAQNNAIAQQKAATQQAYQLQQQALGQALQRFAAYQQANPNPIYGMSTLQAPNQGGAGMTFGGGVVGQPGTPDATQSASAASQGWSTPQSIMSLLQSLQAGQPSPTPTMPNAPAAVTPSTTTPIKTPTSTRKTQPVAQRAPTETAGTTSIGTLPNSHAALIANAIANGQLGNSLGYARPFTGARMY